MATSPDDRRYSKEHEWLKIDADVAIIGITDYAQDQLGDVVYVDLPPAETRKRSSGCASRIRRLARRDRSCDRRPVRWTVHHDRYAH